MFYEMNSGPGFRPRPFAVTAASIFCIDILLFLGDAENFAED
jgi:hypothetical protein